MLYYDKSHLCIRCRITFNMIMLSTIFHNALFVTIWLLSRYCVVKNPQTICFKVASTCAPNLLRAPRLTAFSSHIGYWSISMPVYTNHVRHQYTIAKWLAGKTRPRNDLLCVEWEVKLYTHRCNHVRTFIITIVCDIVIIVRTWLAVVVVGQFDIWPCVRNS